MAEITLLPNFANQQGANTQVIKDSDVVDNYWKLAENRYRNKVQDYVKAKDEADERIKMLNFDLAGVRPQDIESGYLPNLVSDFGKYASSDEVVKGFHPTSNDPESIKMATDLKNREVGVRTPISLSKQRQAMYSEYYKQLKDDPDGLEALNQWYSQKADDPNFQDFNYVPRPEYNVATVQKQILDITPSFQSLEKDANGNPLVKTINGQVVYPEITELDIEAAKKMAANYWDGNVFGTKRHFTELWNEEAKRDPMFTAKFPTPKDYSIFINTPEPIRKKEIALRAQYHPPQSGSGSPSNLDANWVVDNTMAILDPSSSLYTQTVRNNKGEEVGKAATAFDGLMIPIGGKDDEGNPLTSLVRGVYYINGKVYINTGKQQDKNSFTSVKDLTEVTNPYTQLLVPFINQQFGNSPTTSAAIQKATDYAYSIDKEGKLKLPNRGQSTKNNTTKGKAYSYPTQEEAVKHLSEMEDGSIVTIGTVQYKMQGGKPIRIK